MNTLEKVKNFFGLIKMPFANTLNVNELYKSSSFEEAYTRLTFALDTEKISVLTGESGSGKSSVLRYFTCNLDPNSYKIIYTAIDKGSKISQIAKDSLSEMQMPVPFYSNIALRTFRNHIIELNNNKGIKPILIIDEAQELYIDTLISLKTFLNYQMDSKNYLFLILCGQKNLLDVLELSPLESINRRIRIRYFMKPLNLNETSDYIQHQMAKCGLERNIFPDDVKANIYNHTKGNISAINNICFNCVIVAASKSKDIIDNTVFEIVISQSDIRSEK